MEEKRKYVRKVEEGGNSNKLSQLEEQVEKGLFEYLEGFYGELVRNYSHVAPRTFTALDINSCYCLLYFPSERTDIKHSEVDLDHVVLTLNKTKEQPCLCSLYELRYSLKGQRLSKKRSCALGYIVLILRSKLYRLEPHTILLQDSLIASPIEVDPVEDVSIKSLTSEVEDPKKDKKVKQICEIIPDLYSLFNLERSREFLSFNLEIV